MLLEVANVIKKYERGGRSFPAVDNLSLTVNRVSSFAFWAAPAAARPLF